MLVGTSLGACLKSMLAGEVSPDDVLVIITRTQCKDLASLMNVVEQYYLEGNKYATVSDNYDLTNHELEDAKILATDLWNAGKIHQPRNFNHHGGFVHPDMTRNETWLAIAPSPKTDEPLVLDAYNKYLVLKNLMI
jgi:hypothetical protein